MNKLQGIFFRDFKNAYVPHILKEIYFDRIYDPYLQGKKDLTIVDIGCNIGLFTFYAQEFGHCYCFEPSKQHFDTMTHMFTYNGFKNVSPFNVAVSNKNGTSRFYHNQNTTMYSLNAAVNDKNDYEDVETIDMERLAQLVGKPIDFLKLDVEGHECEILASDAFTKASKDIKVIAGEYHQWASANPMVFASMLRDRGYEFGWMNNTEASTFIAIKK